MKQEKKDNNMFETTPIVSKIEITCKSTSLTWDKSCYKEELLAGIIEREEFDAILEHASKILGDSLVKKRENDEVKLPRSMVVMSTVTIILSLCYLGGLIIAASSEESNATVFLVIAIICLAGATTFAMALSIINYCRKIKQFKTLESFIKEGHDYYFAQINTKFTGKCEFRYLPLKEQIIELVTFVKTAKMIEDDINENRKLVGYEDDRSQNDLSQDDESRANFKLNNTNRKEVELGMLSSKRIGNKGDKNNKEAADKNKKFGKVKKK